MKHIQFFSFQSNYVLKNKKKISKWVEECVISEGKRIAELSIILCSDEYLRTLNAAHLSHDYYTDILTFDFSDGLPEIKAELYVSTDRVRENAAQYHVSMANEMCRVIIHGVLHLCGYDDKTQEQKEAMRNAEERCLSERDF
ncbi:MAG: rRNA maturation RNase YbeY [Candidatus Competibacteraceae bacterium]|nr:rRNA maturation RNase YbeY [Candidatus Competibacteraceae bacterium]